MCPSLWLLCLPCELLPFRTQTDTFRQRKEYSGQGGDAEPRDAGRRRGARPRPRRPRSGGGRPSGRRGSRGGRRRWLWPKMTTTVPAGGRAAASSWTRWRLRPPISRSRYSGRPRPSRAASWLPRTACTGARARSPARTAAAPTSPAWSTASTPASRLMRRRPRLPCVSATTPRSKGRSGPRAGVTAAIIAAVGRSVDGRGV